jgi:hypothetical protein
MLLIVSQAPAWCAELRPQQNIYTIEKNTFTEKLKPWQLVSTLENKQNSSLWLASIIIPGLGQALSGGLLRGLTFTAMILVLTCLWGISRAVNLTFFLATLFTGEPEAPLFGFVENFILVSIAAVYIWNIFDAYFFSNSSNIDLTTEMQRDLTFKDNYQQKFLIADF